MTINIGNGATPATPAQLLQLRTDLGFAQGNVVGPGLAAGYGVFSGNKSNATGCTIQNKIQAPAAFAGVRLYYHNHSNADVTLNWGRVGVTAGPLGSVNGSAVTFTQVSFNGSTSPIVLPAWQGALLDEVWSPVVSDYVPLVPVDSNNYLVVRSYYPSAAGVMTAGNTSDMTAWQSVSGLQYIADTVTGQTVGGSIVGASTDITPHGIVFYYQNPVVSVGSFGGSHLRGNQTTGNAWGFIFRACMAKNALNLGKVYSPFCNARGGQGNIAAMQNVEKTLASGVRLDIAIMLGLSGNDSDKTASGMTVTRGYLGRGLDACRKYGTRPIVCTAPPSPTAWSGSGDDARRSATNDWIRNLQYHGISVMDLDALYRDPANPAQLNPVYNSGDDVHVNDAGQAVSRDALMALLP